MMNKIILSIWYFGRYYVFEDINDEFLYNEKNFIGIENAPKKKIENENVFQWMLQGLEEES